MLKILYHLMTNSCRRTYSTNSLLVLQAYLSWIHAVHDSRVTTEIRYTMVIVSLLFRPNFGLACRLEKWFESVVVAQQVRVPQNLGKVNGQRIIINFNLK